jgi:hypothetical protein
MDRFTVDDGAVQTLAQWAQSSGQDRHSLIAAPAALFLNAAGNDYHLVATSPARDAGITRAEVPNDRDGVGRPVGTAYDIGAYEFRPSDLTPPAAPQNLRLIH